MAMSESDRLVMYERELECGVQAVVDERWGEAIRAFVHAGVLAQYGRGAEWPRRMAEADSFVATVQLAG